MTEQNKVTSLDQLREYARGTVVQLPPFAVGQPFYARLRRPSMMALAKTGNIPNSLLLKANELFVDPQLGFDPNENNMLTDALDLIEKLAEQVFVEPTYNELKEAGVTLTDEQYMFIFNYTQTGVKALEPFHTEPENRECSGYVEAV